MGPSCPVCGASSAVPMFEKREGATLLHIVRCDACSHAFLETQPTHFEAERYDYYRAYLGKPRELRQTPLNERRYLELLETWGAQTQGRRLLDVGCGDGHLVHVAATQGWQSEGIDLAEGAIALAQSWGINCKVLDFFDSSFDGRQFDVIYMSELIEHVPNPVGFIERASQLLAPSGVLYLTTPNFDSLSRRALGAQWHAISAEHLSYFNSRSLERLFARVSSSRKARIESRNVALPSLIRGVAKRLLRRPDGERAAPATTPAASTVSADQMLRRAIYASPMLVTALGAVNVVAKRLDIGDTLIATAK
ncbi:MAG: class I SAM-dependent methyltransferase [Archangium sp.]|nr:class I SAM-dependent methyltransferase [Archangium sp.]